MHGALTAVPQTILSQLPCELPSVLSNVGFARVPAQSSHWKAIANSVSEHWSDGGIGSAASSLQKASGSAAELETDATTIDTAVGEGSSAIAVAVVDLSRIACEFIQRATMAAASSAAGGPAGLAAGVAQIAVHGQTAMAEATVRIEQLSGELAGPISTLNAAASHDIGVPTSPVDVLAGESTEADTKLATSSTGSALKTASFNGDATNSGAEHHDTDLRGGESNDEPNETGVAASAPADASVGAGAPTPQAQAAVDNALSAVGTPYQWGGNVPGQGLDCSGLTHWAYGQAGVDIPRIAEAQTVGSQVSQDELLPGDLVVWDGHVAMAIGNGQMVEAGDPVQVNPIRTSNMGMSFKGFYRPTA